MKQIVRRGRRGRVWAVVAGTAAAAMLLAWFGSEAHAQTFNDAIRHALDNTCAGLRGPYQGALNPICNPPPPPPCPPPPLACGIAPPGAEPVRRRLDRLADGSTGGGG